MSTGRGITEQQIVFTRQATILRRNLIDWDGTLRNQHGEDWPSMLGRLNASFHQTTNMDRSIEDVLEHFVYVPKKCTANAQDVPFFLSTRIDSNTSDNVAAYITNTDEQTGDPLEKLSNFERTAARIAAEYEEKMARF